jgi:hypothetical protein
VLELGDIDLVHLQHGLHGAFGFFGILVAQEFTEGGGDDLPGEAEFIFHPAAAFFFAAGGELVPQFVDFRLGLAVDKEGDGGRERELRTSVEGHELLSFELKGHGHDRAPGSGTAFAATSDADDLGVFENRGVEVRGLFSLAVEPQERRDFLHVSFAFLFRRART